MEVCRDNYDETYSPEDAFNSVQVATSNHKPFNALLNILKRESNLGFSYPHEAVSSMLSDAHPGEMTDKSKTEISEWNSKFLAMHT